MPALVLALLAAALGAAAPWVVRGAVSGLASAGIAWGIHEATKPPEPAQKVKAAHKKRRKRKAHKSKKGRR